MLQREGEARKKGPDEERKKRLQRKGKKSEATFYLLEIFSHIN